MDNSVIIGSAAGGSSGTDVDDHVGSIFLGYQAGRNAGAASRSVFLGYEAGHGAANAGNSIFIGTNAGKDDTVDNVTNLPSNFSGTSILIGNDTDTGGYSDSIALGEAATNTASNQFMVGSSTTPVDTTRINGSGSTQCTITTGTGISCSSDERLKTNITDLASNVLDTITKMRSVKYKWKNDGPDNETHIGFIAQDVQKYYPEIVQKDHDGLLSVNYAAITPVLVQAVRELNQKVENVKKIAGDFKESLFINIRNWLGNAGNGISNLYATVFHGDTVIVKNVCIEDDAGNKTCITKARLDELIDNTPTSVIYSPSNSLLNGDTTLNNDENVEEENTDASDALEETTETEEDGEVLGIDSENSLDENVEEENTNTEESNVDSQQDVEQVEEVEETETLTDTESQESVSGSGLDDTDDSISGSNTE